MNSYSGLAFIIIFIIIITYGNYKLNKEMSLYTSKANELKLKYYPKLLNILKQVPDKKEQSILKDYIKEVINISLD